MARNQAGQLPGNAFFVGILVLSLVLAVWSGSFLMFFVWAFVLTVVATVVFLFFKWLSDTGRF